MRPACRLYLTQEFANVAKKDLQHSKLGELNKVLTKYGAEIKRTHDALQETLDGTADTYDHWNDEDKVRDARDRFANDWHNYDVIVKGNADSFEMLGRSIKLNARLRRHHVFGSMVR